MAQALDSDITGGGLEQGDLVKFLGNVRDAVNELITDHATNKTFTDELKTDLTALIADVTAIRAEVVKLVTDNASRISDHNTLRTKLNADAGVTDTDYAAATAATAANPAALTVTAVASSGAATLTNATALTLQRS